ncbi:MAG: tRNA (adenosine(37)-N6)-threonylcarbamoyltransferase complex dimerization subunit type 1 TsaB [Ruminococcaceae bacterium]|nr:tRNA (adenosine(37)-N6)-threonylcarbamoyltransferase complex dimerization subunit type 1 TsaB [Oscillospiraceae bacterium]
MKILALDSTAKTASVCICEDERLISIYSVTAGLNHSETLLPMVENALKTAQMNIDDIDMFAISDGPGSFTGVRIGVSLLKGLAFGKNKLCLGVSTLEALAYNLRGFKGLICPVMDARRDQVYNALFMSDGQNIKRLTEDRAIPLKELQTELESIDEENIYLCGDGYSLTKKTIEVESMDTPMLLREQNAYSVAQTALKKYNENKDGEYTDRVLKPTYLRVPQAERERLERINKEQ